MRTLKLGIFAILFLSALVIVPPASANVTNPCPPSTSTSSGTGVGVGQDNAAGFTGNEYVYVCLGGQLMLIKELPYGGHPCDASPKCNVPMFYQSVPFVTGLP